MCWASRCSASRLERVRVVGARALRSRTQRADLRAPLPGRGAPYPPPPVRSSSSVPAGIASRVVFAHASSVPSGRRATAWFGRASSPPARPAGGVRVRSITAVSSASFDELLVVDEHRHDKRRALRMRADAERMVVEDHVARLENDAEGQPSHEERQVRRLREHTYVAVVERDGEVEDLLDGGGERGAHERALHLTRGRIEPTPHVLRAHRVRVMLAHGGAGAGDDEPTHLVPA